MTSSVASAAAPLAVEDLRLALAEAEHQAMPMPMPVWYTIGSSEWWRAARAGSTGPRSAFWRLRSRSAACHCRHGRQTAIVPGYAVAAEITMP